MYVTHFVFNYFWRVKVLKNRYRFKKFAIEWCN